MNFGISTRFCASIMIEIFVILGMPFVIRKHSKCDQVNIVKSFEEALSAH